MAVCCFAEVLLLRSRAAGSLDRSHDEETLADGSWKTPAVSHAVCTD